MDEIERNRLFAVILELEDARSLGSEAILGTNLLSSPYPEVRKWCAVALGRIGDPRSLAHLCRALDSPYSSVRAAAAFAIGEMEDRESLRQEFRLGHLEAIKALRGRLDDTALEVRMRIVEALGKAGGAEDATMIALRLSEEGFDGSPGKLAYLDLAITALMRLKNPDTFALLRNLAWQKNPDIQWRAANALVRVRDKAARPVFLNLLESAHVDVKAWAALGLGICEDPELSTALLPLLPPTDSQTNQPIPLAIRFNAVRALGMLKSPISIPAIEAALRAKPVTGQESDQTNFAIAAADALGSIGSREGEVALRYLLQVPGPAANAAIIALAKVLKSEPARFFELAGVNQSSDPPALRAWARALGELGGPEAVAGLKAIMLRSTQDHAASADLLAIPTVLTALATAQAPDLADILKVYFGSRDGVVLRAAAEAYKPGPESREPWAPLIQAYFQIAAAEDVETKASILEHLEPWIRQPEVQTTLRAGLSDRLRNVRIVAAGLLRKAGAEGIPEYAGEAERRLPRNTYEMLAGARSDRTVAILETNRGNIEVDLFRADAPLTVANFVGLAKRGFFDGQSFMRVVPFFVVQSGDPRNDQEGGPGYSIRCEINMRPYERGSVGMALAGKDTGGSQFFITLAPQPHLDGGYTCFGRVISGMLVADRLVPGDRIKKVTIEEDITAFDYRRF